MLKKFSLGYSYEKNKKEQKENERREELLRKNAFEVNKNRVLSENIVEYMLSIGMMD
jgi:hypothetical protein